MSRTTRNSKVINAPASKIYRALTDPGALAVWLAPGDMTGKVHDFDLRVGGGYSMSLFYPDAEKGSPGKTAAKEDRFTARFTELIQNRKIVQSVNFDSDDTAFAGEMIMEVTLEEKAEKTIVTFIFHQVPSGIRLEDNEKGTKQSMDKLAHYVE